VGAFYTNVVIRDCEQQQIADFLRQEGLVAYVSPTVDGWTVVYERGSETQREGVLEQLAARLSAHLETVVFAVLNHDDDILCYWQYERGTLLDQYNSAPSYFCGPDVAAIASYLMQHSLWAFLSPTIRGFTVVYEQRSEALGQQDLALLANRLSDELACAVFAVQNVENEIFWKSCTSVAY